MKEPNAAQRRIAKLTRGPCIVLAPLTVLLGPRWRPILVLSIAATVLLAWYIIRL